jgi:heptosyltransferase III
MKNILISRTDKIGDVILTLPMVVLLKKTIPDCTITFIGNSYTRPIIECCSAIDHILEWDSISNLSLKKQAEVLKNIEADTIIHVFPRKDIAIAAFQAKIKLRIGTSHRFYNWFYCNKLINFSRKNSDLHEAQLNLKLIPQLKKMFSLEKLSEIRVLDQIPSIENETLSYIDSQKFNLIIHPHSKGSAREWPISYFIQLCKQLPSDQFNIIFCGTEAESYMYRTVLEGIGRPIKDAGGKLSLKQYISLISACDGLVAASTGPLHICAAMGKHAFGIYPPIKPMHPGRWAPLGKHVHVMVHEKNCSNCRNTKQCQCMWEISPLTVFENIIHHLHNKIADK